MSKDGRNITERAKVFGRVIVLVDFYDINGKSSAVSSVILGDAFKI